MNINRKKERKTNQRSPRTPQAGKLAHILYQRSSLSLLTHSNAGDSFVNMASQDKLIRFLSVSRTRKRKLKEICIIRKQSSIT